MSLYWKLCSENLKTQDHIFQCFLWLHQEMQQCLKKCYFIFKAMAFVFIWVNISNPMCSYLHPMKSFTEAGVNMWVPYLMRCHCSQMYVKWLFNLAFAHSFFLFLIITQIIYSWIVTIYYVVLVFGPFCFNPEAWKMLRKNSHMPKVKQANVEFD